MRLGGIGASTHSVASAALALAIVSVSSANAGEVPTGHRHLQLVVAGAGVDAVANAAGARRAMDRWPAAASSASDGSQPVGSDFLSEVWVNEGG
jgi:hypothetical protein